MQIPISFPAAADVVHDEAVIFRRLAPDDRVRAILDLIACGEALLQHSPKRDWALRLKEDDERAWQSAYGRFFEEHSC